MATMLLKTLPYLTNVACVKERYSDRLLLHDGKKLKLKILQID